VANNKDKNFGLAETEFNGLRDKLADGDEQLFEHVFLQHFEPCLAYVIREDKAAEDVAYDSVMDAFLSFRMKVVQGKINYGNLRYLLTRMARQYYYKRAKKEADTSLEPLNEPGEEPDFMLDPSATELLQKGWKKLGTKCRELLHSFYYLDQELKGIAAATDRTAAAVRKQKQRCIDELRGILESGGGVVK
jgi:DNA-directed RNA polymerase specialized sigma24 family protein